MEEVKMERKQPGGGRNFVGLEGNYENVIMLGRYDWCVSLIFD